MNKYLLIHMDELGKDFVHTIVEGDIRLFDYLTSGQWDWDTDAKRILSHFLRDAKSGDIKEIRLRIRISNVLDVFSLQKRKLVIAVLGKYDNNNKYLGEGQNALPDRDTTGSITILPADDDGSD